MTGKNTTVIGIIGGRDVSEQILADAYHAGKLTALNGYILVTGGLGGVMEASSKGAFEHGGISIGIVPSDNRHDANPWCTVVIPSGMGVGRNVLVVRTADIILAFPGSYGTLSEIGFALNLGKRVIGLPGSWDISQAGPTDSELFCQVSSADQAFEIVT